MPTFSPNLNPLPFSSYHSYYPLSPALLSTFPFIAPRFSSTNFKSIQHRPFPLTPPFFWLTAVRVCVQQQQWWWWWRCRGGGCQTICSCFLGVCRQEESAQGDKENALESTFLHCLLLQCPAIPICYTHTHTCT